MTILYSDISGDRGQDANSFILSPSPPSRRPEPKPPERATIPKPQSLTASSVLRPRSSAHEGGSVGGCGKYEVMSHANGDRGRTMSDSSLTVSTFLVLKWKKLSVKPCMMGSVAGGCQCGGK
jgi:hypothetical protein